MGGNLYLNGDPNEQYFVEFTLIGSESGYENQLQETYADASVRVLTEAADQGASISYQTAGGNQLLAFQFNTLLPFLPVINGSNGDLAAERL